MRRQWPPQAPPPPRAHAGSPGVPPSLRTKRAPKTEKRFNRGSSFPSQVARQLQPSVVWIEDTEKTFYKKVPNAEKMVRAPPSLLSLGFPFLRGGPPSSAVPPFREGLAFSGEAGSEGQPSPGVSERVPWADFTGRHLEENEGLCGGE